MDFLVQRLLPVLLVLLYQILPWDVLPDFLGPLGRLDDMLLLGLLFWYLWSGRRLGDLLRKDRTSRTREARGSGPQDSPRGHDGPGDTGDPYSVLGIPPGASMEDVHRAYRREMAKYHPDRVSHLGEELQRVAHRKSLEIQEAYQEILRRKGQRVQAPP